MVFKINKIVIKMESDIMHTMLQFILLSQPLYKLVLKMDYVKINLFAGSEVY